MSSKRLDELSKLAYRLMQSENPAEASVGVVLAIIAVIAVSITVSIGYGIDALTTNDLFNSGLTSGQSAQQASINNQLLSTFTMATVVPTVMVAGIIIGSLLLFFTFRRR
jgi:hypothetical protein